ncbi:MAG: DUF6516 family protein [Chloroflexota bacterium]|nr:DUF6516 family protein [Chloroflexota bacterium]
MSLIEKRLYEIERKYAHLVQNLLVLRLTEETLKLIFTLNNGSTLRVAERWQRGTLTQYSYYWLDIKERLKIGWDNVPHHKHLANFPHHKRIGTQAIIETSYEVCLEDVIAVIENEMNK